jgi:hypothetical protein
MGDNGKYRRIFEFVLVIGLAIVFLAIVMMLSGMNGQAADIYVDDDNTGGPWDGSMANPYQNITSAIDNSIPLDAIYVWDGSYNENITIDKSLQLIGNGSATTKIDGFGTMNNIINITAEGVEITGFNITESGMWYGIWTNVGGFNIHHNKFYLTRFAIVLQNYQLNLGSTTVGDIIIDDNEIEGDGGFYLQTRFEQTLPGADLTFGQTIITNNTLNISTSRGIEIDEFIIKDMVGGSITCGDILINDNTVIVNNGFGVFFWGYLDNLTDVSMDLGRIDVNGNNITSQGGGICVDWWDFYEIRGNSIATIKETNIYNNTIISQDDGIVLYFYRINYFYGSSSITTGDFHIYSNNITNTNPLYDGICIDILDAGKYLYNDSSVNFGNIYIDSNIVDSNNHGIYFDYRNSFGADAYDNAIVTMGDVQVTNNEILSVDHGIYISLNDLGSVMYDQASSTLGNFIFTDNNISSGGSGINIDMDQLGFEMHDGSSFATSYFTMEFNNITSVNTGINIQGKNIARNLYNDSQFSMGDFMVNDNIVNSTSSMAINFAYSSSAYTMTGNATATFGNSYFNDNEITSINSGFYFYFSDLAFTMAGDSYFEMGNLEVMRNTIISNGYGINFAELGWLGNYLSDTSVAVFGDFIFEDNTINASNDGVNVNAYEWGSTLSDNSSATFGDFSVSNNNIESGYQGIFFQLDPAAYDMHDMARFEMGNLIVSNNTILSGKDPASIYGYGISIWTRAVGYDMHNESQAIIGSILFNDNDITVLFGSNTYGINIYRIARYGYNIYDNASFTMNGNLEVCRNTVNTTNGEYGIFCSIYENGYNLYNDSTAHYGNFLFNDNIITDAFQEGMYIIMKMISYNTFGNSSVTMGNVEINDNDVSFSTGGFFTGIELGMIHIGASMYDDSIFNIGHVQINDNTIVNANGLGISSRLERLGYDMHNSSSAYFGEFQFNHNNITSQDEGIYFDYCSDLASNLFDNAEVYFGNFLINNNIINTTRPVGISDGIDVDHFQNVGYQMNDRNYAEFGNFEISNNEIYVNSSAKGIGIWLLNWASNIYDNATFVMGDFNFIDNTISTKGNGIYWEPDYFGAYMYDNSTATIGNNFITGNEINIVDGYGLYAWWWYEFAYDMHNNSRCTVGNTIIMYNTINVTGAGGISGIWTGPYDSGENVYDNSTAIFGDYIVSYNTINTVDADGLQFSIYAVGYNMDGFASVTVGNISVSNNIINSTNGNGIYIFDTYQNGNELYDNAKVTMGNIEFNDNQIEAGSDGITCDNNFCGFGSYLYNNSKFEMGDFNLIDNIITANYNGIYFEPYYFGAYMEDNSTAIIGNILITGNEINVVDGYGLYAWWWYWFAHEMYDNSTCRVGDSVIMYNVINVTGSGTYGIYTGPWESSQNVYGNSRAIFGDYIVNYNTIYANNSFGIEFDIYHTGYQMYDNSNVTFGQIQINDNNITAPNGAGLYFNVERLAYNIYNNSYLSMGNIQINGNNITCFNNAIDLNLGTLGFEIHDFATASFGSVEIDNNILISSVNYGIYFDMDTCFSSMYGNSSAQMENIIISNNVITSEDEGIQIIVWGTAALYDNATAYIPGFLIMNNIVDSNVSALDFSTENTPFWNDPNAVQVWGDVILENNYFDAGLFGAVFDWENQNPDVPQPIFYINYTRIVNGSTNSTGLFVRNIDDVYIEDLLIDNITAGILINNSIIWMMLNSTISNTLSYDMNFTAESYIRALNCTFNKTNVNFEDDLSLLRVGWFMHFLVRTKIGYGIPEANLTVGDAYATVIFNGTTNSAGRVSFLIAWDYEENITGIIDSYNNHTAQAHKSGSFGFADENINVSKLIIIVLLDPESPIIFDDKSDSAGTTGDSFNFEINATDNLGVLSVHVNYRQGSSGNFTNLTMSGTGPYLRSIVVPLDHVGVLEYYFSVQDIGDNWISTAVTPVPITDNDAPTINADNSDSTARTGDAFDFFVDAVDNINITGAYVVWWFGTGAPTNDTMDGPGPYSFAITVPIDSLDMLHYYFTFTDEAGNWIIGLQVDISIKDNRPPELISINSDTTGIAGEYFEFNATISDNIEVSEVLVIYWFGTGAESNATMTGTEDFTFKILLPPDSDETLHYYITARDSSGNVYVGSTRNVPVFIVDKSPPEIIDDSSDTVATTGDDFTFKVTASDDFAIGEVHVVYWFGTGDIQNITIVGDVPFTVTITTPVDSLETLHYYFTINDTSDNWLVGPQHDIMVTDNDAPSDLVDNSQIFATTGEEFIFTADASDNIGVVEIEVFYWFGGGTQTSQIMTGTGPFTHSITIPSDSLESLHYYFVARDAHGNAYQGAQKDITIADNDPGSISNDASDTSGKIGEEFKFQIDVSDNIGISEVRVAYWFGVNESRKQFLTLVGTDGTYSGSIILEDNGTLHYYFEATDEEGNTFEGPENSVDIAALPKEKEGEEPSVLPWILLVILIVIVVLFFILMTRKKREPEEIPVQGFGEEPEEDLLGEEEMGEELEDEELADEEPSEEEESITEEEDLDNLAEEDFEEEPEQVSDEEIKPEEELDEEIDEKKIGNGGSEEDLEE